MNASGLTIGISFRTDLDDIQNWWGSGIAQNIKFYYDLFEHMGHNPCLLTTDRTTPVRFSQVDYRCRTLQEIVASAATFDVILEAGITLSVEDKHLLREVTGAKIVGLRCGNQLFIASEGLFVRKNLPRDLYVGGQDRMWILPHYANQASALATLHQCEVDVVPYIWMPDFVSRRFTGDPLPSRPDIYIMEPNISSTKNALIPMLILQRLYEQNPESFSKAYVLNSQDFAGEDYFLHNFVNNLPVLQAHNERVYFHPRYPLYDVFSAPAVLLGYQHENGLNNLYKEALYMGLPLVHNSRFYERCGYFYADNDIDQAVTGLLGALEGQGRAHSQKLNDTFLEHYRIDSTVVQAGYDTLLASVIDPLRSCPTAAELFQSVA